MRSITHMFKVIRNMFLLRSASISTFTIRSVCSQGIQGFFRLMNVQADLKSSYGAQVILEKVGYTGFGLSFNLSFHLS